MRGALLVVVCGGLGLVLGAAVAGRPQDVPSDVVVSRLPDVTSTPTSMVERASSSSTSSPPVTIATTSPAVVPTTTSRSTTTTSSDPVPTTSVPLSTVPTTSGLLPKLVPESEIRLLVANATDAPGLAARTLAGLRAIGYSDGSPTDAVTPRTQTVIVHVAGRSGEALRLAAQIELDPTHIELRGSGRLTRDGEEAEVWLLLGTDRA